MVRVPEGRDRAEQPEKLAPRHGQGRAVHRARYLLLQAAAAAEVERRPGAVGVALVLAQVHVDAADELTAEDRVQHEQRVVIRVLAIGANLANAQLGLRRAASRDDRHRRAGNARGGGRRRGGLRS